MKRKIFLIGLPLIHVIAMVTAQNYEIRAVNRGEGTIGIEMRVTAGTAPSMSNFVTDITFGIKWQSSYNVDLETVTTSNYNIVMSDARRLKGSYHFQAFSAANTPFRFPLAWGLNTWVEILSVKNTMTGTGTGTFEIAEPGFDNTTDPNFGVDLIDYTPAIGPAANNVLLPVHLTKFNVLAENKTVKLEWATTNEQNSKGFEVERSEEGAGYKKIGWLSSKGGSGANNYEFADKDARTGLRYYYRLKQLDKDGRFNYSEVKTILLNEDNRTAIRIVPNPAYKELKLLFDNPPLKGPFNIKIIDVRGATISTKAYLLESSGSITLDVSNLVSGQYFLVIENGNKLVFSEVFTKISIR